MKKSEVALLLGACAARDSRTVGDADVLAWFEDLGDLDFEDARQAVSMHYRESTDRIMPAHIRRVCRIIRDKRRAGQTIASLPPGRTEDDPARAKTIAANKQKLEAVLAEIARRRSVPAGDDAALPMSEADKIRERALSMARETRRQARVRS